MSKPRICEILGVEPDERFNIAGYSRNPYHYDMDINALLANDGNNMGNVCLCNIINNPSLIKCKPRLTDEEKEILQAAVLICNAKWVARDDCGTINVFKEKPQGYAMYWAAPGGVWGFYSLYKFNDLFECIKSTDDKPTKISDLLGE
jgi:hypothetical protein